LGAAKGLFCTKIDDCARNCAHNAVSARSSEENIMSGTGQKYATLI